MSGEGSVTRWIRDAAAGDELATQKLVDRYFLPLARSVRGRLPPEVRRIHHEHDVVNSALANFCVGLRKGRYPDLADRGGLWKLLLMIVRRKAMNKHAKEHAERRGGGKVVNASALDTRSPDDSGGGAGFFARVADDGLEPPDFRVCFEDELEHLLARLGDSGYRETLLLHLAGFNREEIAAHIERAVRTVDNRLKDIRALLQGEASGKVNGRAQRRQ